MITRDKKFVVSNPHPLSTEKETTYRVLRVEGKQVVCEDTSTRQILSMPIGFVRSRLVIANKKKKS